MSTYINDNDEQPEVEDFTSYGPAISIDHKTGEMAATCEHCTFVLTFEGHTWANCRLRKPSRRIPDYTHTPDWCEMKADMLRDVAAEMENRK